MLGFAVSFTYVVFSLFSIYRGWMIINVDTDQLHMSIVLSMWASIYMFCVITVLSAGHLTKYEVCHSLKFWTKDIEMKEH